MEGFGRARFRPGHPHALAQPAQRLRARADRAPRGDARAHPLLVGLWLACGSPRAGRLSRVGL
eukprot:scaffold36544_cov59-Phaeocystis_antarctica.AAC.1